MPKLPSEVARERIRALRKRHGWTQQELASRLEELGSPMDRVAITKIERGDRGLPLDEALLFALALDVAPINFFLPLDADEDIQLAPNAVVPWAAARWWVLGQRPLDAQDWRLYFSEVPEKDFRARQQFAGRQDLEDLQRAQREQREFLESHQREGEILGDTARRLMEAETLEDFFGEGDES